MPQLEPLSLSVTLAFLLGCLAGLLALAVRSLRNTLPAELRPILPPTLVTGRYDGNWLLAAGKLPPKVNRQSSSGRRKHAGRQPFSSAGRGQRTTSQNSRNDGDDKEQKWLALLDVDLSRITLTGWALLLSTFGVMLVGVGILVIVFPDAHDQIQSRAGKRLVMLPIVGAMAGWFAGGRHLLLKRGFVLIRPKK